MGHPCFTFATKIAIRIHKSIQTLIRRTMTKNEIDEIFEKLRQSGLDPQLCDTAVPYFADGVPAGYPEAPGDYDV